MSHERKRLEIQAELDGERSALERNAWGQFATPPVLARQIARYAISLASAPTRMLEPGCGSGSFISAALDYLESTAHITGVELDQRFAETSRELWDGRAVIVEADFMDWVAGTSERFDLVVANPPYVRHHHLSGSQKERYKAASEQASGVQISGLSGLYLHFMLATQRVLRPGAVSTWLIPSEFMATNYGSALREFLSSKVTLDRIHVFAAEDMQFHDALVTSAVATFINGPPSANHRARLTMGLSYDSPTDELRVTVATLAEERKWLTLFPRAHVAEEHELLLGDFFAVKRGIATGNNKVFILEREDAASKGIDAAFLRPVLPSPRVMKSAVINAAADGWPTDVASLALVDCPLPAHELLARNPALYFYLHEMEGIRDGYLVSQRSPWYKQEQRPAAPIICTYMGRTRDPAARPFRFLRNKSQATVTNVYLALFPLPRFLAMVTDDEVALDVVWEVLNSIDGRTLAQAGREYGGGLKKIEPKELGKLGADGLLSALAGRGLIVSKPIGQQTLFA